MNAQNTLHLLDSRSRGVQAVAAVCTAGLQNNHLHAAAVVGLEVFVVLWQGEAVRSASGDAHPLPPWIHCRRWQQYENTEARASVRFKWNRCHYGLR